MCILSSTNPLASPLPGDHHNHDDEGCGGDDAADDGHGDLDRPDDDDEPDLAACESPESGRSSAGRH